MDSKELSALFEKLGFDEDDLAETIDFFGDGTISVVEKKKIADLLILMGEMDGDIKHTEALPDYPRLVLKGEGVFNRQQEILRPYQNGIYT